MMENSCWSWRRYADVRDCLTIRSMSTKVFVSLAFPPCPIPPRLILSTLSQAFGTILASDIRR